ncbi:MAG: TIGR02680 family protein [Firmicutes bacterium]|nr:TIGR02680 family protein [Bacillota bacterium]
MKSKWRMHRAGLVNFWYYDEEEFYFADGKLLLRGSNGSGKSVTMQSLIPLLLDGKKSPDRLDPFGSRARRIEDYLLGEKELVERDERTGYLYLEYKREHTDQYLTTGIGLQARNHAPLDFWGFVIHDNRRLGHDLWLYKTEYDVDGGKEQKIPLSRRELENLIGDGGKVVRTQGEYMELVNRYVFGFESLDAYEDLIKLLIQLRSPKLSKDFKPTVIYEILNDSLPALSDDELRPLSDTIESMDQTKLQLEQLRRVQSSLKRICRQYDEYNRVVLAEKADGLLQSHRRCDKLVRKAADLKKQLTQCQAREQTAAEDLRDRELEQQVLSKEVQELREHDVFKAEAQKQQMEGILAETITQIERKADTLHQKRRSEGRLQDSISEEELKQAKAEARLEDLLASLDMKAVAAGFIDHSVPESEFRRQYAEDYDFGLWRKDATDYQEQLEKGLKVLREETKAKERYHETDRELAQARMELNQARDQERRWGEVFEEEKATWLDAFHRWRQENMELALIDTEVQSTCQRLMGIYEQYRFEDVRAPVFAAYNRQYQGLERALVGNRHQQGLKEQEIKETQEQLRELKATKDVEPPRHPDTETARAELTERGIPYVPFFAAVEFKEDIDDSIRERIEAAVAQMGLLDALIISKGYHAMAPRSDQIIKPRRLPKYVATTLADVLYPTPVEGSGVSSRDIAEILASIAVRGLDSDQDTREMAGGQQVSLGLAIGSGSSMWDAELAGGATILDLDGTYHVGPIYGHAPLTEQSIYIGKEARRQYRLRKIAYLESELTELESELAGIQVEGQELKARQKQLTAEYEALPADSDLGEAYLTLEKMKRQTEACMQDVEWKNEKVKESLAQWQMAKELVRRYTEGLTLASNEKAYEVARRDMQAYLRHLQDLQLCHKDYLNCQERLSYYSQTLEDVQQDVDDLQGELNSLQGSKDRLNLELEQVKQRLEELGAEEIRAKIASVVSRLEAIPGELKRFTQEVERAKYDAKAAEQAIAVNEVEITAARQIAELWKRVFREDVRLIAGFYRSGEMGDAGDAVTTDPVTTDSGDTTDSSYRLLHFLNENASGIGNENDELVSIARLVIEQYGSLLTQRGFDRAEVANRLNRVYYEEQAMLLEYSFNQEMVLEVSDLPQLPPDELITASLEQLRQKSRRVQLSMDYFGKRVSPYFVAGQIDRDIELQQSVLDDQDRELYEEIIMHSVGRIIRARINRAEQWAKKIDQLMAERDTSSGLTFSLRWSPRPADYEDELDTKDLVDLLRSDPRLLKEKDMERITGHFRSRIRRARVILEDRGLGYTLHQAIREMLDYRQWFSFKLYYQRAGEPRRELTNNVFYKLSGGEKAMAMYIPLFSAAYSRYLEARADAPYIISLDEAFAGVDENNIRDMFDLVEKLGFDYIMNSQSLWGDYDTVSSLSIAELVRPKNAPYVGVVRYHWNGKVRQMVTSAKEYETPFAG